MTWTYSGNPSSNDIDKYRFAIGDTIQTQPVLQDEEIQYILDGTDNENKRLYELFDRMANKFAREVKRSLGPQSEDASSRLAHFTNRASYYKSLTVAASGLSLPKCAPPIFSKGMHDNV